jgi:hypothetical protein
MKSFNNSSVKALVLVAGVLASHFALHLLATPMVV